MTEFTPMIWTILDNGLPNEVEPAMLVFYSKADNSERTE